MHVSPPVTGPATLGSEQGFGLIELLVSMLIALVVSLAAFSILQFTTDDVSRITSRTHVDQTGRVALEKIMLELHSACVSVNVNPIQPKSNSSDIKFISETSPLNTEKEPVSSLSTVKLHEIAYNESAGTLTEKSWKDSGTKLSGEYKFNNETESPLETKLLLTGVTQTGGKAGTPIFQYFRYYKEGDPGAKLGEIYPSAMTSKELEFITNANTTTETTEAEKVAKVTMSFTLTPEGHESIIAKGDQPIALEDSAVFRLAASSESGSSNLPCTQQT
jgi:prepilin-type N-terminal cleavage/methylation domain-containing protein